MPQVSVNSVNIINFGFSAKFDIYNRSILFETAPLTSYNSSGINNVLGIAFSLVDSVGLELMGVDWLNPQIIPATSTSYTLDLTSLPINFLFQNYSIIGYIKDADGTVYQTDPLLKKVCQPSGISESGYVPGDFEIIPDCVNNNITVKEFSVLVYDNKTPTLVTKDGTLYYPTGTLSPVTFTGTPFSNNKVYTGSYRITCTTVATYDLGDNISVLVTYYTDRPFPITCSNFIGDITCCLTDVYNIYQRNCENAVGQAALQKYNSVLPSILNGLVKQINGQDASLEVAEIKKLLNCDCGAKSLRQNEATPTNPAIYSIVLNGVGGTSIAPPTITGNTKTYNIASKAYVVAKGDTGDLAFTIETDTSVENVVTYKITFNYDKMALYILNAIKINPTLINLLNSLFTGAGASIAGLDGKCVIDLSKSNYSVSQAVNSSTLITQITINGVIHNAPSNLFANNGTSVASWLNSLTLGTFTAVVTTVILTIQSVNNPNTISTITFTTPDITLQFSSTNATLVQVLQAIVNYICNLTALQILLGRNLNLCTFDYNGDILTTSYPAIVSQDNFNSGVASAICNIVNRINTLTGVTCATLKAIFIDRSNVTFSSADRLYGTLGGDCAGLSDLQIANLVISAVNKYSSVKTAWCAINCTEPGTCPDISNVSLSMVGSNIGFYGLSWATTPLASQTVTIRYRVTGNLTWIVATNALLILPNGNISGTTPYQISGVSSGTNYDVWVQNNCGGAGFITQITTPTGSVYTGNYLVSNILYDICGGSPMTLYSSAPFATGITMFTDIGLTTPLTGYVYITPSGGGSNIFNINTSTGVVGSDTGSSCTTGTAGTYVLGNDTGTICSGTPITLYTNGAFAVGQVLYVDSALTTPQTGYSYAVYNGIIYTVNSATGAVTGTSGLSCAPLDVVLTKTGTFSGNLDAAITGGIAPYNYEFSAIVTGPCQSYTIGTPTGTTSGSATSTYSAVNYSGVTYQFICTVTDSVGTVVVSNIVTCPSCLVPSTLITLKDGSEIMLSDIEVGQELWGDNKVESKTEHTVDKLYDINHGLLKASEGHIHIVNGSHLVQSLDLQDGDILTDKEGNEVEIISIEIEEGEFEVINIATTTKEYISNGISTHNKISCP